MNDFIINVGDESRSLKIEPVISNEHNFTSGTQSFKIYSNDDGWTEDKNLDLEDVPVDSYLGTISIKSAKEFTFDGRGALSGEDLLFITNQLVNHPSFKKER